MLDQSVLRIWPNDVVPDFAPVTLSAETECGYLIVTPTEIAVGYEWNAAILFDATVNVRPIVSMILGTWQVTRSSHELLTLKPGRTRDDQGQPLPGATIVERYDLMELGLAWRPDKQKLPQFATLRESIIDRFKTLL